MINKLLTQVYMAWRFRKGMQVLKFLKERDHNNFGLNLEHQKGKLSAVLNVAFSEVPYYKSLGIRPAFNNLTYSEFCNIPVLTKDVIRNNGDVLVSQNDARKNGVRKNTSGGSTGEPLTFFRSESQDAHARAAYYHSLVLNNVNLFEKSVDLWGAERDMHAVKSRFNIRSVLNNKTTLNTFVLSDEKIRNYIERMNVVKPAFIKAYVHSLYNISQYINKHNIKMTCRPVIQCTTGPLYPEMRNEIKKAFNNAHVYDFYGSREVSSIAFEVFGNDGLYVCYDNLFLEILDENNNPVKKGEEGEVVVTTLNNYYMPLIRYKIGDRAIKGDSLDFGTLKLDKVVGRTLGVIYKADGTKIDGQFFTTLFFSKPSIKSFQLVQETIDLLNLNIIKNHPFSSGELDEVLSRIRLELPGAQINVNFCETIDLTQTGKIMYVYSKLDKI